MKKSLFILSTMTLLAISLSSCSNGDYALENNETSLELEQEELQKIQSQIINLNASTFGANEQTRGFGRWFKKFLGIVVSDAVGGFFGSLVGGPVGCVVGATATSGGVAVFGGTPEITRAVSTPQLLMNEKSVALDGIILNSSSNPYEISPYDSIGYYHNKVLIEMNNSGKLRQIETIQELNRDVYINTLENTGYDINGEEADAIINNSNIVSFIENSPNYFSNYNNLDSYLESIKTSYPNISTKVSILGEFMNGLSTMNVNENDGNYAQQIIDIINNSNLDEEIKKELRNAIIIGNASYQLWNVE